MDVSLTRAQVVTRALVHEIRTERITFMAGTIAYNAFLSLLPLFFVLLSIASAVGGNELERTLISLTQALVTAGAADLVVTELRNASTGESVVGLVALVWGMLRIFRCLDTAFSDVYETQAENTLSDQLRDGIYVFGSITALLLGVAATKSLLGGGEASGLVSVFHPVFLVCVVALTLVPLYYVFPDEPGIGLLEILPGVLFAAVVLVALQSLFGYYVAFRDPAADNQLLASIVMLLVWLYLCGLVVLLGAAMNAVLSNRSDDVDVDPVVGGVHKAAELTSDRDQVPEATLERLRHALDGETELRIVLDGDAEDVELPPPDFVTVDSNASSLPLVNDTTSLELQWTQAGLRKENHE